MRITVLGATGRTGAHLVRQACAADHQVTAVVRDPAKLTFDHPNLTVIRADVLDPTALIPHLRGQDAALSALGPANRRPTTLCADSARSLVQALSATEVRRLIVVSTAGATDEGDDLLTRLIKPVVGRVFRHAWGDLRRMEEIIMASDLDWTIVRPPRLTNAAHTGEYRVADGHNLPGGTSIPRADLAEAMLDALTDPAASRAALSVAS